MTAAQVSLFEAPPMLRDRPAIVGTLSQKLVGTPRPYQHEMLDAIEREHQQVRATLVVAATGTGKTVVFAEKCRRTTGRALVISDRDDLVSQNRDEIADWTGEHVGREQAEWSADTSTRIVVASAATLVGDRLERFARRHRFDHVIYDEAHHAPARTRRAILAAFPDAKVTGFTATPRPKGMGSVFDSIAYEYGIDAGKRDGWLVGIDVAVPGGPGINLDGVSAVNGELAPGELDAEVARHARDIVDCLLTRAEGMRTVIFTPGVLTAHAGAQIANTLAPGCARSIDGKMDRKDCTRIKEAHQAGEFPYLFNCRKLVEGYNDRRLLAVLTSPGIKTAGPYVQQVGRGTRTWPGTDVPETVAERLVAIAASPKPRLLLLDPGYNSERHDLASPVDLVPGELSDEDRKVAKKILREKGGSPEDAVAEAKARAAEREARLRSIAAAGARMKRRVQLGEPRDLFTMLRVRREDAVPFVRPEDRPTAKQAALFRRWGLPAVATKREWRKVLGIDKQREAKGLCRLGGINWLARHGINGWPLTRLQALRVRAAIADNGYRPVPIATIDALLARAPGEEG